MSGALYYRLVIRDAADTFDALILSSYPSDDNPFLTKPPKGDGESIDPLSGKVGLAEYVWHAADAEGTLAQEREVWREDFSGYADTAALLAVWDTEVDPNDTATWTLDSTRALDGSSCLRMSRTGDTTTGWVFSLSRVVGASDGLEPNTTYKLRRTVWRHGTVGEGVVVDAWDPEETEVTTDASGDATVTMTFTISVGTSGTTVDKWFDQIRLVDTNDQSVRIVTGLLGDSDGKWAGVNRKCTGYESTDGSAWTAIHAGYLTQVTLTGGIEYALHVGDSDRRERNLVALVTRPTGTGWTGTNIVGAPPSFGPGTGYPPKWRFRVDRTHDDDGDLPSDAVVLKFVSGWALSTADVPFDAGDPNTSDDIHLRLDDLESEDVFRLDALAAPYAFRDTNRLWVFGNSDGGLVATLTPTAGGTDITAYPYGFTLPFVADFGDSVGGGTSLLALNTYLALKWTGTLPSDDTEYDLVVGPLGVSKDSPAHFSGHPVAFVTTLFDAYSIPYDSTSATSVTSGLGVDMRINYRFTDTFKLWDGIEKWAFGPFGFAVRKNTDNEWEFYQTRTIPASEPSETLDEDAIHDPDRAILDLGTENQVTQVVWKMQRFKAWTQEMGGEVPADGIVTVEQTLTVNADDVDPDDTGDAGTHTITYEVPGLIFPYPIDPDLGVFLIAQSTEIMRRWGRGCPSSDIAVLRSAGIAALVGEFVIVDLDHKPTIDTGETVPGVRGGSRICQVVHRTLDATGPMLGLLDVGVATTNELVPTFTLAQGTDTLHQATVTLTNSGSLTGYQVQWQVATGSSEPAGGTIGSPFTPDAVAHNLPLQSAGSTVWVRMRTVKADELPGSWSDWDSVALDAVPAVTSLANAAGANDTERVLTWTVGDASLPVRVRWKATADADYLHSVTLPAGSNTYTITGITPGTAMTAAVDHVENSPFTGDSADETTTWTAGSTIPTLTPPTNPQGFTDGTGNFGLQVNASVLPSRVVFEMAVEDSVGAGTYGSFVQVDDQASVASGPTISRLTRANDGLTVKLRAKHTKTGYTDSAYTAAVIVDPWDTEGTQPDPGTSLAQATDLVMLWSGGLGVTLELVGIKRGKLALQYSLDGSTGWDFVDGTSGCFVSLQNTGMQRGAQVTPASDITNATADVAFRIVTVDESDTAATVGVFPRIWKFPVGVAAIRIGCEVVTAGEFDVDPAIANVWVEFLAAATTTTPPDDGDLPTDPDPITTTNLVHWYKADVGVTLNGSDQITTLENQASGSDLTGVGDSAVIQSDAGLTAIRFGSAGTGYLAFPSGEFTGRTAGHLFMLVRSFTLDHSSSESGFVDLGTGNSQYGWGGNLNLDYGTNTLKIVDFDTFDITDWHVLEIECDGTDYIVRLNGTAYLTTTNTVAWTTVGKIGSSDPAGGINGNYLMYEFIEYSARLGSTDAQQVRDWLAFRGGITL